MSVTLQPFSQRAWAAPQPPKPAPTTTTCGFFAPRGELKAVTVANSPSVWARMKKEQQGENIGESVRTIAVSPGELPNIALNQSNVCEIRPRKLEEHEHDYEEATKRTTYSCEGPGFGGKRGESKGRATAAMDLLTALQLLPQSSRDCVRRSSNWSSIMYFFAIPAASFKVYPLPWMGGNRQYDALGVKGREKVDTRLIVDWVLAQCPISQIGFSLRTAQQFPFLLQ